VIPYQNDPVNMNNFKDLTEIQLAERPQLYEANFLHYQMAETNTSIREGWFYRDEEEQKVRSADDVFDIYERSVGGNSIFLLNIPPNREGTFSSRDVEVLREVGSRIKNTYNHNLLEGAIAPVEILDEDEKTYKLLSEKDNSIIIQTKEPITINRFLIQEGVATHGERIESHRLSYWKNGVWKEIIKSSNVGYKRILRFPTVTASKFKLEVLKSRFPPALSKVAAFYYHPRPPQLTIQRNSEGMVTIAPKKNNFKWKPHGEDVHKNLYSAYTITYTDDESTPTHKSLVYKGPFYVSSGTIKARFISGEEEGSITSVHFGSLQKKWIPVSSSEEYSEHPATLAFDGDRTTYWKSKKGKGAFLSIDLGEELVVTAIGYTPPAEDKTGMIESGQILISQDGKNWIEKSKFSFGNLINDPTSRQLIFDLSFSTRYLKIEVERIAKDHENACIAEWDVYVKE
jgi:alpha-L-fucosidase